VIKNGFVDIINSSLHKKIYPAEWKTFTIAPIPKTVKPKKANDFRLINMLPIFENILKLMIKDQLKKFSEINDIITKYQSGFRKSYLCDNNPDHCR